MFSLLILNIFLILSNTDCYYIIGLVLVFFIIKFYYILKFKNYTNNKNMNLKNYVLYKKFWLNSKYIKIINQKLNFLNSFKYFI